MPDVEDPTDEEGREGHADPDGGILMASKVHSGNSLLTENRPSAAEYENTIQIAPHVEDRSWGSYSSSTR